MKSSVISVSSSALWIVVLGALVCTSATSVSDDARAEAPATEPPQAKYADRFKQLIANLLDGASTGFKRKLLNAELSPECSLGLIKFIRGIKNLEPWAMRMFDASGKYPTGALQTTRSDLGAFDECVETVVHDEYGIERVRGQYCNLQLYAGNKTDLDDYLSRAMQMTHPRVDKFQGHAYEQNVPLLRLGICMLDDCSEQDLQKLLRAVVPPALGVTVTNCVTSVPPTMTKAQVIIIAFLGSLSLMVLLGTAVDVCSPRKGQASGVKGVLLSAATAFSVVSNTRMMLRVATDKGSEAYCYRFLHGLRFLSIVWVVVGHCYGSPSDVWARFVNALIYADHWENTITAGGFISVDTFFFLSGFLLAAVVCKQKKNPMIVFVLAVIRRFIRTMAPVFFVIMCLHLTPLIVSGPDAKTFFTKVHEETHKQWLPLLLQVQNYNFSVADTNAPVFGHLWYLALDFQYFLVCLPILLLLKRRPKFAVAAFTLLSLLSCAIATWQVAGTQMTPFVVVLTERLTTFLETGFYYYFYPFYHAPCYFTGCITFFLVAWYKEKKMSKAFQTAAWCIAIASGLTCFFLKTPWYQTTQPTNEFGKLSLAFFDRILWSVCLLWVTLACAIGRGGFLCTFLSWSAFTPLSRLAFGVYIIHLPFVQLMMYTSRERMFFSHFFVVSFFFTVLLWSFLLSYLLFVFCEAPTGRLDKLIFDPPRKRTAMTTGDTAPKSDEPALEKPCRVVVTFDNAKKEPVRSANGNSSFKSFDCEKANLTSCHL